MVIIKKITKLKNLGVYTNFSWGSLPEFKQYNVIYGWNGTGKSTLSKLLGAVNTGSHPEFPTLEYQIQDSDGILHIEGTSLATQVRVFNIDFVVDNIDFDSLSSKVITVILGKENKEALEAIDRDEKELADVVEAIKLKTLEKSNKEKLKGAEFTAIAKVIGMVRQGGVVRSYIKTHAENAFAKLQKKELLDDATLERLTTSVAQASLPVQAKISIGNAVSDLSVITSDAKDLLDKTVEASIIERLKENGDISEWVETGIEIHNSHKSDNCEFCGKPLDASRLNELTAHFNEADAKLKIEVDNLANRLFGVYNTIKTIDVADKMNVYQELRNDYDEKAKVLITERDNFLEAVKHFGEVLHSKKLHTTEKLAVEAVPDPTQLVDTMNDFNDIISQHNKKTNDFIGQQSSDGKKIENHHLSTIFDKVEDLKGQIHKLTEELTALSNGDEVQTGRSKLLARITENKAKISSSHKACDLLNTSLKKFLGHEEIAFRPNDDDTGYLILRRGNPAKSLSEGERTAIAFVFFVTQLKDDSFDAKNGIIVIDDPVSSLDANSQFQAFSFLKEATKDAGQLFLFTHSFEFLKLILYWVNRQERKRSVYMVNNSFSADDGSRTGASLVRLDPSLENFESEYHYLFNLVYAYGNGDGTIASAYTMPNVARKLLDSFLMFRVPKNVETYARLQELDFDEEKKTAIYKFTNDQSHITGSGFDPSLVPETQKCLKHLLELMEVTFPEHYKYLVEAVQR